MKEQCQQDKGVLIIRSKDDTYYKVLGSFNYILRLIEASGDKHLDLVKNEILVIRERVEDLLLEVNYSDK